VREATSNVAPPSAARASPAIRLARSGASTPRSLTAPLPEIQARGATMPPWKRNP
jgi:hypothetical protein